MELHVGVVRAYVEEAVVVVLVVVAVRGDVDVVDPDVVGVFYLNQLRSQNGRSGVDIRTPMASPLAARTLEIPKLRITTFEASLTRLNDISARPLKYRQGRGAYIPKLTNLAFESLPIILVLFPGLI